MTARFAAAGLMGWYLWPIVALMVIYGAAFALKRRSPRVSRLLLASAVVVIVIAGWPTSGWWLRIALIAIAIVTAVLAFRKR